ncbi:hypothetical protein OG21DRAFT_621653 [Imleria badia]|nr:hypothetical protein OG21DRAFT_621653 [Imleria badia]
MPEVQGGPWALQCEHPRYRSWEECQLISSDGKHSCHYGDTVFASCRRRLRRVCLLLALSIGHPTSSTCGESCSGKPHCGQLITYYVRSLPATSYSHAVAIKQPARLLPCRPFLMFSWLVVHMPLHCSSNYIIRLHGVLSFSNPPEEHYSPSCGNGSWLCSMYQPSRSPRSWNLVIYKAITLIRSAHNPDQTQASHTLHLPLSSRVTNCAILQPFR